MVSTLRRSNLPLVWTVYVRVAPGGIGPPAPVWTLNTPRKPVRADSAGALFASSAIAATGCVAIVPTLQTSTLFEWTTSSGGESGCEPAGVRFAIVTCQVREP